MGKSQLRVQQITRRRKLLLVDHPLPHKAEELQLLHTAVALMMMKTYSFAKPLAIISRSSQPSSREEQYGN
jgi:hypothetical protein